MTKTGMASPTAGGSLGEGDTWCVERYRGKVDTWEVLNEPIFTTYALPRAAGYMVDDYIHLLKTAYEAIRGANLTAKVVGGIAGWPDELTMEFVRRGGLKWVDILNLHTYPGRAQPEVFEGPMEGLLSAVRERGEPRPIWVTEFGYYGDDNPPSSPSNRVG